MAALNKCIFSKKSGRLSSVGPEILAFISRCLIDFQPILDCFIPNFELKYEYSENIKTDRVNKVVFNLHQIKFRPFFFLRHPTFLPTILQDLPSVSPNFVYENQINFINNGLSNFNSIYCVGLL